MLEELPYATFSPITGMYQGKFTQGEAIGTTGEHVVRDGENRLIKADGARNLSFREFVDQVKKDIPIAKSKPLPNRTVPESLNNLILKDLPGKIYSSSSIANGDLNRAVSIPKVDPKAENKSGSNASGESLKEETASASQSENSSETLSIQPNWSYDHRAKKCPIIFDPVAGPGLIYEHDEYQMAYWNDYADIYRVYTNPSPYWAWQNGRYEIAGFQSNQTMIDQFGEGWGPTTLAVCWYRWDGTGFSIEADIAMNPAFSWTVNDYDTYYNSGLHNADHTLLHEIGHSWGLNHQWYALSVMNYAPHKYRAYTVLNGDDTMAIRAAFPGQTVNRTDICISLFYANGYQNMDDCELSTTTVQPGNNLTVSNFMIENSGTNTVAPKVEWHLVPTMNSWASNIYIAEKTYGLLNKDQYHKTSTTLTIPSNTPCGSYYLGAYIRSTSFGDSIVPTTVRGLTGG